MNALLETAEQMLVSRIVSNAMPFTGRTKAGLGLAVLTGLMVLTGIGFLFYAAFLWMNTNFPPETAPLYSGVLAFVLALVTSLSGYLIMQYKQRRAEKADVELSKPINENPKTTLLIASLAGYFIGGRYL